MKEITAKPENEIKNRLDSMITLAELAKKPNYTTGEVAKILRLCVNTIKKLCDIYEPEGETLRDSLGLQSWRSRGGDRRIPYIALAKWLEKNDSYERDYG